MNKLVAAFMVAFLLLSILSGIMDGSSGAMASTNLTAAAESDDATLTVTSTTGFLSANGVLILENEKVSYTGVTATTFTGVTRGFETTEADAHANGTAVYNEDAGVLNYALGYNVIDTSVPGGQVNIISAAINFATITIPKVVMWDYAFFEGDLVIVRYLLIAVSVGVVVYISYMAVGTVVGVLRRTV